MSTQATRLAPGRLAHRRAAHRRSSPTTSPPRARGRSPSRPTGRYGLTVRRVLAVLAAVGMVVARGADPPGDRRRRRRRTATATTARPSSCAPRTSSTQCQALGDDVEVRAGGGRPPPPPPSPTAPSPTTSTRGSPSTAWLEVVDSRSARRPRRRAGAGHLPRRRSPPPRAATTPSPTSAPATTSGSASATPRAPTGPTSATARHAEWRRAEGRAHRPRLGARACSVLASASAGFFGTTDFAANDPAFAEFEAWLANLAEPVGRRRPRTRPRTLATRPGTYSAAGSIARRRRPVRRRAASRRSTPTSPVAATVAIVELGGRRRPARHRRRPRRARGRRVGDAPTEDDLAPTLKPGVMAALHSLWRAVTT